MASVEGPKLSWSETFLPIFQTGLEEGGETSSPRNREVGVKWARGLGSHEVEETVMQGMAEIETLGWATEPLVSVVPDAQLLPGFFLSLKIA